MSYDDYKTAHPAEYDDGPAPVDCCVCGDSPWAPPCSEDCADLMGSVRRSRQIRGLYEACRRAIHLARLYSLEGAAGRGRIERCIRQINLYRVDICELRSGKAIT